MKKSIILISLYSFFCGSLHAQLRLVANGTTDYVISYPKDAPSSVINAGQELSDYIKKSTNTHIKLVFSKDCRGKRIAIGFGKDARDAGLTMDGIKEEGFRIMVKGDNVYIYGKDTPDGKFTKNGGFSRGTLFGVYAFLEKFLGIRWIMPGELGEIIPENRTLSVPEDLDFTDNPGFLKRFLYYRIRGKEDKKWLARQRLGSSLDIYHGHIWHHVFGKPHIAEKHPEWFAEIGGKRVKPVGLFKICTSNPEVVKYMAGYLETVFEKSPQKKGASVSATDGWGFCQCEKCRELDESPLPGETGRKYTRRMLIFYNRVAELLSKKYPNKWACGYVYQSHEIPPENMGFELHKNVYLCWAAAMDYGIRHYIPGIRTKWHKTLKKWSEIAPGRLGYYDLPNQFFCSVKIPSPPCRAIMNDIMPAIHKAGVLSSTIYGTKNWESGGIINYVNAKMMWNPNLNADDLAREYCDLAYGEGGKAIKALYDFLEEQYQKYMVENQEQAYKISPKAMREIYAANFNTLENFYKDAAVRPLTVKQRKRLDLFCFDMVRLHRYLKAFGWLKDPEKSIFDISEKQYKMLCRERGINCVEVKLERIDREVIRQNFEFSPVSVKTNFKKTANTNFWYRRNQIFAVKAERDEEIVIPVNTRKYRTQLFSYIIYSAGGNIVKKGTIPVKGEVRFFGHKGVLYYIRANAGGTGYNLNLNQYRHAVYSGLLPSKKEGFCFFGGQTPIPVYFFVPPMTNSFTISLRSGAPSETAVAVLYNPAGEKVAELKTLTQQNTSITVKAGKNTGEIWKLQFITPGSGVFDDAWLRLEDGLSGWFSFSPSQLLHPYRKTQDKP